jgi:pimeloyl-ACP methyl ester carboxylesterase
MGARTIVFIHGMYMTPLCWEGWVDRFQSKGYHCLLPAWPGRERPIEALRKAHPDPELGKLTLRRILDALTQTIQSLDEKPVLIGHSMGGLITQLLLQENLAATGIAIDSAPPVGVLTTDWSFLKANWGHITPFVSSNQPVEMTFKRFQYAFVNSMPRTDQEAAFEKYAVPESRRVPRDALTAVARIDFSKPHPPLLLIAGSIDHLIPPSLVRLNYRKYHRSPSLTDFKEFPNRNHFIIGQTKWEQVADYCLDWLGHQAI